MSISALGWFQIANRHTFGYIFRRNLASPKHIRHARELITEIILNFVRPDSSPSTKAAVRPVKGESKAA